MRKILWSLILLILVFARVSNAQYMLATTNKNAQAVAIKATSFPDYPPFGSLSEEKLNTLFKPALEAFAKEFNFEIDFEPVQDYQSAINQVRQGKIDLLLGIYYATERYNGLEYIFPAVLHNPVHVMMLPENISKINTVEDLKKLKGVYIQTEHYSDYMLKNFKNYNIPPISSAYEAYEKLFVGDIDYIIGSYYYNYAYVISTGLKDYVSFSKTALWNMPLFIGVSKASRHAKKLTWRLKKSIISENFKQKMTEAVPAAIHQLEQESQGVVPPKFVRIQSLKEATPADEHMTGAQTTDEKTTDEQTIDGLPTDEQVAKEQAEEQ